MKQAMSPLHIKPDLHPTQGAAGDPYRSPVKYAEILKQKPIEVAQPKFIRDSMYIDDIEGVRTKSIYKGVAKDILSTKGIDRSKPKVVLVS
jgi:hypothetical protein